MSKIQFAVVTLTTIFSFSSGYLNEYHFAVDNAISLVASSSSRIKRSGDCTTTCAQTMMENMQNKAPDLKAMAERIQDSPTASITKMPKEKFKTYCLDVMKPFLSCIDACDSSTIQTLMQESLKIVKVMCVDRYQDVMDNYECLNKTEAVVKQECVSNKCPNLEDSVKPLVEFKTSGNRDIGKFSEIMGNFCEATGCSLPCMKNVTARQCGEKIAKIATDEMIGTAMSSLRTVFSMAGGQITFPDKCEKVIRDTTGSGAIDQGKPTSAPVVPRRVEQSEKNQKENSATNRGQWISVVVFLLCLSKLL